LAAAAATAAVARVDGTKSGRAAARYRHGREATVVDVSRTGSAAAAHALRRLKASASAY